MTSPRRRWSYSLRTLLVVVTVALLTSLTAVVVLNRGNPALESKNNIRQLCWAAMMYKHEHGAWPESLDDIKPLIGKPGFRADMGILGNGKSFEALMVNPLTGDTVGYLYVKPTTKDLRQHYPTRIIFQLRHGKLDRDDQTLAMATRTVPSGTQAHGIGIFPLMRPTRPSDSPTTQADRP